MFHLGWLAGVSVAGNERGFSILNFDWLSGVPIEAARWGFLGLFLLIGLLVLLVPADYVFEGLVFEGPAKRRWRYDLRLWAIGVLALLFFTYAAL